ncbi:TadE/TadG family type IV pilus assembly protein [Devosia sp. Root635]|uniref:TadE/TadG family type IV pilus assembly protein n=1 Tax=Devosia sp. Root635 TaxID=1736575 RepID=UPI0006FA8B10|nr:TadE/TadG family type IV pilus assembly protein [Devosia sp. Root635]KRA47667.1 pilus assembly protein TadE [Devosia sp. Root635]
MRIIAACIRDRRGTSAVEFAILTPVFLLLLTGMLAYGIYFSAAHSLQQLAADAARTAIAGLDETERNVLVADFLAQNADSYALIDANRLSVSIGDKPGDPDHYRVVLSYDAGNLPIWNLALPLPLPSQQIAYSSTIRRGGI